MNRQDAAAQGLEATEFEKRLVRAQMIMHRYGFDAFLCTAPANVRYFTGFDTQCGESPRGPRFVIVPFAGALIGVSSGQNGNARLRGRRGE